MSVSFSDDGAVLVVGASDHDGNGNTSGRTRIYNWYGSTFNHWIVDIYGEAAGDTSGAYVIANGDGTTVAIGAPWNSGTGTDAGWWPSCSCVPTTNSCLSFYQASWRS